jgi:hypothetical protein
VRVRAMDPFIQNGRSGLKFEKNGFRTTCTHYYLGKNSFVKTGGVHMNLWYVIQTKPKKEEEAKSYLSTKGVEIFNPLLETFLLRNGRMNKELKPLFPNYIFGKFDLDQNYPLVRWAKGVKRVLGFGEYPTPISEEAVEIIKGRTDSQGIVRLKSFSSQ